jgi:tetratricopeptide (TPR) repeat protein
VIGSSRLIAVAALFGVVSAPVAAQKAAAPAAMALALERYERGDETVAPFSEWKDIRSANGELNEFRRAASAWVLANGAADLPRRRLVVATFTLEMLALIGEREYWRGYQPAAVTLEWACTLLRAGPPSALERSWQLAALALLEQSSGVDELVKHLQHARERFPVADRWVLIAALAEERRTPFRWRDDGTYEMSTDYSAHVTAAYEAAVRHEGPRDEAQIRWGAFELFKGRAADALAHLQVVREPEDPSLRYWLNLFQGRALQRLHRSSEAIDAYERALEAMPTAQAASFGLAAALALEHRTVDASRVTSAAIASSGPGAIDPWFYYYTPDLRFWRDAISGLRSAIHP